MEGDIFLGSYMRFPYLYLLQERYTWLQLRIPILDCLLQVWSDQRFINLQDHYFSLYDNPQKLACYLCCFCTLPTSFKASVITTPRSFSWQTYLEPWPCILQCQFNSVPIIHAFTFICVKQHLPIIRPLQQNIQIVLQCLTLFLIDNRSKYICVVCKLKCVTGHIFI